MVYEIILHDITNDIIINADFETFFKIFEQKYSKESYPMHVSVILEHAIKGEYVSRVFVRKFESYNDYLDFIKDALSDL